MRSRTHDTVRDVQRRGGKQRSRATGPYLWRLLVSSLSVACVLFVMSNPMGNAGDREQTAEDPMQAGRQAFRDGRFSQAAIHWTEAARAYESQGKPRQQAQALINLAHALELEGQMKKAVLTLQVAYKVTEQTQDMEKMPLILDRLGNAAFALGQSDQAVDYLTKGLELARTQEKPNPALVARLLNNLGGVLASRNQSAEAINVFNESHLLATQSHQEALAVTALVNMGNALIDDQQYGEAQRRIDNAYRDATQLEDSHTKASALLNIGLAYDDLRKQARNPKLMVQADRAITAASQSRGVVVKPGSGGASTESPQREKGVKTRPQEVGTIPSEEAKAPSVSDKSLFSLATSSFASAAQVAGNLGDTRTESFAWGYLGQLTERQGQYEEALSLTRKAVFGAQKANAPESLYLWHWQTGRLLTALGKHADALAAYKRAVAILQPIRTEFSVGYQGRHHSFQDSVSPLFTELTNVMLRRAAGAADPEQEQQWLVQTRDTLELLKAAELQDYFRDDCVKTTRAQRKSIETVSRTTAIVYPIILPDRVELLVNLQGRLKRFATPVTSDMLTKEVRIFRKLLQDRNNGKHLQHGQTLYDWLLRPLENDLLKASIDTLVFVPDGALRTIPMSALHDGKRYLIQKYAVAIIPGMDLIDPRPIDRHNVSLLSMGLTEPVQGFPALPNVGDELKSVKDVYGGKMLMNDQFVVTSMQRELKDNTFNIVHIASHGLVDQDVNKSFLLAYDDKITMQRLSEVIGLSQFRSSPIELLTLSACETAVGDDRAALGLAGVAVKAGARSALATLWFIDDEATSQLVAEFYRQLGNPSISKAVALQRAQLRILGEKSHDHPSFWAPFLLINNWL
jgi:CHAT domain-containing protein